MRDERYTFYLVLEILLSTVAGSTARLPVCNVTINHFIRLALLPELAGSLDSRFTAVLMEIGIAHDFAANELVLEIGVDDACRLWCFGSLSDGPGTNFIGSAGEIPNKV